MSVRSVWWELLTQDVWWAPQEGFAVLSEGAALCDLVEGPRGRVRLEDMSIGWRWASTAMLWRPALVCRSSVAAAQRPRRSGEQVPESDELCGLLEWTYSLPLVLRMHALNVAELPGSRFEMSAAARRLLVDWCGVQVDERGRFAAARYAFGAGFDEAGCALVRSALPTSKVPPVDAVGVFVSEGMWPTEAAVAAAALEGHPS